MKEILIKILIQMALDEERRKKIYIIKNPLSVFKEFIFGDEILAIEQFQKDYGYNQSIGIYDKDYIEADGQDYGDLVFTDSVVNVVYFNQLVVR